MICSYCSVYISKENEYVEGCCQHIFHIECVGQNYCVDCDKFGIFNFLIKLKIINEKSDIMYEKIYDCCDNDLIKKIIETEYPHLVALGYAVYCDKKEIVLDNDIIKYKYDGKNKRMVCELSIIDVYLFGKKKYMHNILKLNFDDYEKLRLSKFPYSFDINNCEKNVIKYSDNTYNCWIIKQSSTGILIYSADNISLGYPFTRYLYVAFDGHVCKIPLYYCSLEMQIPENYDIDKQYTELLKVHKLIEIDLYNENFKKEKDKIENMYDISIYHKIRASISHEGIIIGLFNK